MAAPCKICGFSSPNFVPTRREDSGAWHQYVDRSGKTRSILQKLAQAPDQAAAIVECIAVKPQNYSKYQNT